MSRLYVLNGPDAGRSFQLHEGDNTIGRSFDNDVTLQDKTVSRHHLKIMKKENRYFVTDLESRNGTFFGGKYLAAGIEREADEGVPVAMGMTVVSLGETSMSLVSPFLDSVGLTGETGDESGIFLVHKDKTNQKKLEALYRVSDVFEQKLPLKEAMEKVVDTIVEFLVEIDVASIILIEPNTTKVVLFSHRSRKSEGKPGLKFSPDVLYRVVKGKKPVMISNCDTETADRELASTLKMHGISSVLCVPVTSGSELCGVVYLHSLKKPYGFRKEDVCLFEDIAQRTGAFIHYAQYCSDLLGSMEDVNPQK